MSAGEPPQVLVVDDDAVVVHLLQSYFRKLGWPARFAKSTQEALASLQGARIDTVLIDLHLDRENGLDLIRRIRADWPAARVVAMSGTIDGGAVMATSAGAVKFLAKPFQSLSAVRQALEPGEGA